MTLPRTAVLFDPYLDTLGGGERYNLTIAEILSQNNWQVDLAWNDQDILAKARRRFGLKLDHVNISSEYYYLFTQKPSLLTRLKALRKIDLVFMFSDGSVPIMFGKKTFLHYQAPFTYSNRPKIINRFKLLSVNKLIVNSRFTKAVIDKNFRHHNSVVLYPPVDVTAFYASPQKHKLILNVGRFSSPSHSKRQDVLISAFKKLIDTYPQLTKGWRLILAGGDEGSDQTLDQLKLQAKGYPVEFITNPSFTQLKKIYADASIYWHAAGFEVDENLNPEAVEHFGITTVEAMAAGCVPVVVNKGGQKEIVSPDSGFLFNTLVDLVEITKKLIQSPQLLTSMSPAAQKQAQCFSIQTFASHLLALL